MTCDHPMLGHGTTATAMKRPVFGRLAMKRPGVRGLTKPSAFDNGPQKTPVLGFTKPNEVFVGRMAMIGMASSLIGEILTGKGAIAQFAGEIGATSIQVEICVIALIVFNIVAAFLPTSQRYVPNDEEKLASPLNNPRLSLTNPVEFFGTSSRFGFTNKNELFVGRMAQIGFASSLLGEYLTGKGPLAQLGMETGIPIMDAEAGVLVLIFLMLFASVQTNSEKNTRL